MLKSISSIVSLVFVRSLHFTSILLTVFINHSTLAQVVIQEEVVLDTQLEVESVSLTMPFYGQVSGCVNWGAIWNGGLKDVVITAGNQTKTMGFGCLAGYVYCTWYIQNVPLDTDVDITVYGSCEDGQLIEAETQLISTGTNEYSVEYYDIWGNWTLATTVKFTATIPPGCSTASDCVEENYLPEVKLNEVLNGYAGYDVCDDEMNPLEAVKPIFGDPLYDFKFSSCYNRQFQHWWFNLDNNHSFLINYIRATCEENVPRDRELIYDWQDFPIDYGCDNMILDLFNNMNYGGGIAHYLLESIIDLHEQEHVNDMQNLIEKNLDKFYDELLTDPKGCEDFSSIEEVEYYWQDKLNRCFDEYKTNIQNSFRMYRLEFGKNREDYEYAVHDRIIIKSAIYNQIYLVCNFYGCMF